MSQRSVYISKAESKCLMELIDIYVNHATKEQHRELNEVLLAFKLKLEDMEENYKHGY